MTQTEALKLALEFADDVFRGNYKGNADEVITAIKETLAQPEQICGLDVVLDESMPPNTFKLAQPEQQVDLEKLYRLEVKKKEALAAKYERDIKPLTRIVPMAQPEQEPVGYVQTVIEALYENGDPISVDAAELLQRISAQPEQEPVAYIHRNEYNEYRLEPHDNFDIKSIPFNVDVSLFKLPQRTWVGLSQENFIYFCSYVRSDVLSEIEAKLKELNT